MKASSHQAHAFRQMLKATSLAAMVAYVALSLASALAGSAAAVLLVPLVQPGHVLVLGGRAFDVRGNMEIHAAIFAVVTLVFALLRWQAARLAARLVGDYGMDLRRTVHARLIDASLASLADASSAEIANVLTYNVEIITQGFTALLQLLVAGMTAAISLALAFWVSPPLALAAPVLAMLAVAASRISSRAQSAVSRQYVSDLTRLFWHSEDFPRRLRHVRSFGREDAEKKSYGDIAARLGHGYRRQLDLIASGRLTLELLAAVGIAAIFILAYRLPGVDQASLIAVCLLLGRLLPYLISTRQSFQQLHSAVPAFELWQRYMKLDAVHLARAKASAAHAPGALHIERVQLAPPLSALDIRDVSLVSGALTLIWGDSGIGKSSLVDVLAGMMSPVSFAAHMGGHALDFAAYRELVRHGAYVSQSVRPWQDTVRECLLWAAPDASDAMLHGALADVGLDKRLAGSPDGLDTALNNASSRFSGGELQRLLLAQVILRQPFIALLDEATSALDAASEMAVLSALKRRLPETILIVISHRGSVAAIADQCVDIGADFAAVVSKGSTLPRHHHAKAI
ncbi:MAG: ATP-binding cassette domain-containing protein [Dyella sp.]|uniref:ATP-binding cassette domain-containing protein n=1 Tax=Dyella sp. TaxID=1869338 RepID=UPI003F7F90C3